MSYCTIICTIHKLATEQLISHLIHSFPIMYKEGVLKFWVWFTVNTAPQYLWWREWECLSPPSLSRCLWWWWWWWWRCPCFFSCLGAWLATTTVSEFSLSTSEPSAPGPDLKLVSELDISDLEAISPGPESFLRSSESGGWLWTLATDFC